jgi:hypothetical protein
VSLVKEIRDLRRTSIALFPPLKHELNYVLDKNGTVREKYPKIMQKETMMLEEIK